MSDDDEYGKGQLFLDFNGLPISDKDLVKLHAKFYGLLSLTLSCLDLDHQEFDLRFDTKDSIVCKTAEKHFQRIGLPWPVIGSRLRMNFHANCMPGGSERTEEFVIADYEVLRGSHISIKVEKTRVGEAVIEEILCFCFKGKIGWFIMPKIVVEGCVFHPQWQATLIQVTPANSAKRKPKTVLKEQNNAFLKLLLPYGSELSDRKLQRIKKAFSQLSDEVQKYTKRDVEAKFISRETLVKGDKNRYLKALGLPLDIVGKKANFFLPHVFTDPDGLGPVQGHYIQVDVRDVIVVRQCRAFLNLAHRSDNEFVFEKSLPDPSLPKETSYWRVISGSDSMTNQEARLLSVR